MKKRISFIVVLFSLLAALNTYAVDYYIKGTFNNWGDGQKMEKNNPSSLSDNVYMIKQNCTNGTWEQVLFYETDNGGEDYYYRSNSNNDKLALNSVYATGDNGNIFTTGFDNSKIYVFHLDVTNKKVYVTEASDVYLRGAMTNPEWQDNNEWKFTTTDYITYYLTQTIPANKEFKVYDGDYITMTSDNVTAPKNVTARRSH